LYLEENKKYKTEHRFLGLQQISIWSCPDYPYLRLKN
jgi:hypothetical protein